MNLEDIESGDIVLIPFPFTDLSDAKLRPTLVLKKKERRNDLLICAITSQIPEEMDDNWVIIREDHPEFQRTGLYKTSALILDKIATLHAGLIKHKLGSIGPDLKNEVTRKLNLLFGSL